MFTALANYIKSPKVRTDEKASTTMKTGATVASLSDAQPNGTTSDSICDDDEACDGADGAQNGGILVCFRAMLKCICGLPIPFHQFGHWLSWLVHEACHGIRVVRSWVQVLACVIYLKFIVASTWSWMR